MEQTMRAPDEPPPSYNQVPSSAQPTTTDGSGSNLSASGSSVSLKRLQLDAQPPWPSQNPLSAYYQSGPSRLSPKVGSPIDASEESASPETTTLRRGGSSVSLDDPDVRIAAEALADLRADFVSSPPHGLPQAHEPGQQEPLLSLLTTSHPLIGSAIGVPLSAYNSSKQYSTVFRSSAEYVEKRFSPVVNTVGSVGRMTGVEGGVRWFLTPRRPSHHHPSEDDGRQEFKKRRKMIFDDADVEANGEVLMQRARTDSHATDATESLPEYDSTQVPEYARDIDDSKDAGTGPRGQIRRPGSWQSRLVRSTSGLGVAMSDESLRTLRICLVWLREANDHLSHLLVLLRDALEKYDAPLRSGQTTDQAIDDKPDSEKERDALSSKISQLKDGVLQTLKSVIDTVSRHAGVALPENARPIVRRHLTSLPQRFRIASEVGGRSDEEMAEPQHPDAAATGVATAVDPARQRKDKQISAMGSRVIVLAQEGVDMIAQVSSILNGTIKSAEDWCDKLGRQGSMAPETSPAAAAAHATAPLMNSGADMIKREVDDEEPSPRDAKTVVATELEVVE